MFIIVTFLSEPDPNPHVYLAFGQSNMVGYVQIEAQDIANVSQRFKMMAEVDFPPKVKIKKEIDIKPFLLFVKKTMVYHHVIISEEN